MGRGLLRPAILAVSQNPQGPVGMDELDEYRAWILAIRMKGPLAPLVSMLAINGWPGISDADRPGDSSFGARGVFGWGLLGCPKGCLHVCMSGRDVDAIPSGSGYHDDFSNT